uniref:Uncharacterized protein n=1 Tax=Romanomermis culicivorax TaxID=13658 RepID=A0A915ICL3_ROMCU
MPRYTSAKMFSISEELIFLANSIATACTLSSPSAFLFTPIWFNLCKPIPLQAHKEILIKGRNEFIDSVSLGFDDQLSVRKGTCLGIPPINCRRRDRLEIQL